MLGWSNKEEEKLVFDELIPISASLSRGTHAFSRSEMLLSNMTFKVTFVQNISIDGPGERDREMSTPWENSGRSAELTNRHFQLMVRSF